MPKKGVCLPPHAVDVINDYLRVHGITRETFAEELKVTPRTLRNWLNGESTVDHNKLNQIVAKMGIGVEDLLGENIPPEYVFHEETMRAVWKVYKDGLAAIGHRIYRKIAELFREHVSFVILPKRGFFQMFSHDVKKGKNYYFQFWIVTDVEVDTAKFIISFTISNLKGVDLIRINYGEILVNKTTIGIKQYYQPPNYEVKRPPTEVCVAKVVTWFDEMSHTFVVTGDVKFKIVEKGRISEEELKDATDIAVFWRHFFFHADT